MIGALLYLRLTSIRNLVGHRLGRLRQPKYLLGTAFAVAYFYYFFFRRIGAARSAVALSMKDGQSLGMVAATTICVALCLIAIVRVTYAWIWPPEKPGLAFSEAEIAFLFPAPITRKGLIHYRLLSAQLGILFSAVLITIVFNRSGYLGGHRVLHAIGWWIILSTIDLHLNGTNLTLGRLRETGAHDRLWRFAAVAAIVIYCVAVYLAVAGPLRQYISGLGPQTGIGDIISRRSGLDRSVLAHAAFPDRLWPLPGDDATANSPSRSSRPSSSSPLHYRWVVDLAGPVRGGLDRDRGEARRDAQRAASAARCPGSGPQGQGDARPVPAAAARPSRGRLPLEEPPLAAQLAVQPAGPRHRDRGLPSGPTSA